MNTIVLTGNISSDVEVRYTKTGKAVATFNMATNEKRGNDQVAHFHKVVAWEKLGEGCGSYQKGQPIIVIGKVVTRSYDDNNGQKRYITEVIASNVGLSAWANANNSPSNFDSFSNNESIPF